RPMTELPSDMREHNRRLIEQFRAAVGRLEGRALVLLTTIGARSGLPRTTPMMFVPDGDRLLVIASNAGAPRHPDWYRNLVANPTVTVEVDGETYPATATPLRGREYEETFARIAQRYPFFTEHQAGVRRRIPTEARSTSAAVTPGRR
ncbi:MAG TPA: nitroreductase/quinone reductase family protein, partial [Candidatus Nitrosopolaris sp.]|nr:nitroreductase/quinone reductase family protein [Candidatus Nitrosopolaris sp.]